MHITATGNNKTYDKTTTATVTLVGTISGDIVIPPNASTFDNKRVSNNKTITVHGSITGTDSGNYILDTTTTTANITALHITATGNDKTYDRNTAATVTLVGTISGDVVISPTESTFNDKTAFNNKTITISGSITGADSENYILDTTSTTANINPLHITATGNNKTYDQTTVATVTLVGTISGDIVIAPTSSTFPDKLIGNNKTITISGSITGTDSGNYILDTTTTTANINALHITAIGNNKTYDQTTASTVTLVGTISGDIVIPPNSSTFNNKIAEANKTITIHGSITGTDSGNYILDTTTTTATINPLAITATGNNKTYDKTTTATVTLVGTISGDIVTPPTASFANKNVDTNKIITITGSITGTDSINYRLTTITTTSNITKLDITCVGNNKIYDTTVNSTLLLLGVLSGDIVNPPNSTFDNKNVGTNKIINIIGQISGLDSNNYNLLTANPTADITPYNLICTGNNKTYDGTINANVVLKGVLPGDIVNIPSATFNNKNVGNNKTITITGRPGGQDGNNYNVTTITTIGNITPLNITCVANNKIYDANIDADITLVGVELGDDIIPPSAVFDDKNVGTNKTVTITSTLTGNSRGNYNLTTITTTANITPYDITATANSKTYDGTNIATIQLNNIISGDFVTNPNATFSNKLAGNNKIVTIDNIIGGPDGSNYNLTITTVIANITKLNITATGNNKIYDSTINAIVTLVGVINNDIVIAPTSIFTDKTVANNKTVTITGSISGADSGNYNLTTTTTTANITPLNITASGNNKTYDGSTTAIVTLNGTISGDIVNSPSATFLSKTIGTNKPINITGSINGVDSSNYNLTNTTTRANINKLNITCIANDKTYDGTNTATIIFVGVISGDIVIEPNGTFDDQYVGSNKIVTITTNISGLDSSNYNLTTVTTTASINKLDITCIGIDKTYDRTTNATVSLIGVLANDIVSPPTAIFNNKFVETNKTVTITGTIDGTSSDNYNLITTTTTANINKLDITCTGISKTYDGTTNATVTLVGVIQGDNVIIPTANYTNKRVGINKTITINGIISGSSSSNYNLTTTTTRANITKLNITFVANDKIYDGTDNAEILLNGLINGDIVIPPSGIFSDKNAGDNKNVNINGSITGVDSLNYNLTNSTTTASINQFDITCSANDKIYNGNNIATIILNNIIDGDIVNSPNAIFNDKNIGSNKPVTITGDLSGLDSLNYNLITSTTNATITKLDISFIANNKIYNRSTNANISLVGVLTGDIVIPPPANFDNINVGNDKTVTINGNITGSSSNNYNLVNTTDTADITHLFLVGTANNKVYDGTNTARIVLIGIISGDQVTAPSATFNNKNVGTSKTVTINGNITGTNSSNYILTNTTTTANITKLNITCIGVDKIYDRTIDANVLLSGVELGDDVNAPTATFIDKVVGNNKLITVTGSISGNDSGNYNLSNLTTIANIYKLDITCSANNKVYDSTNIATLQLNDIIIGDTVLAPPATFNNKTIGNNKNITINGNITGADSSNYNLTTTSLLANITKLNITCIASNKFYDGTINSNVSLVGIINGDNVLNPSATFDNKFVGTNKVVTITGTISGIDSENYNLTTRTTNADIIKLNITCIANNKIYDSNTNVTISLIGVITGDDVLEPIGIFDNKNVGSNKTVTITGSISGTSSNNYNLTTTTTTANITKLDVTFSANDKTYDGNTTATILLNGILTNDIVNPPNGTFNNKLVGTSKTVTITGSLNGLDSNNYNLTNTTTSADITKLDITCIANNKIYDGTPTCTTTLQGLIVGDVVTAPSALFSDNQSGTNKDVTVTGTISGPSSSNYNLTTIITVADIIPLNITCRCSNKTYDGTDSATIILNGLISGDTVVPPDATFSDKNVGNNKIVTINGIISGLSSSNYNLTTITTTANITKLNITCTGNDKVYDKKNDAIVTLVGVINGDDLVPPDAVFYIRNVGSNIRVTVTGSISGIDSGNYNLTTVTTSANITKLDITCTGNNKIYNNTTTATVKLVGVLVGDFVNPPSAIFDDSKVDINKTVTITGSIYGSSSMNYNLITTATTADITKLDITCTGNNKIYDSTNIANITLVGVISGDVVSSPSAIFDDKNVGTNKNITITGSISGTDSSNYNLITTNTTSNITRFNITCTGDNKVYDGTTNATVTLVGIINGDNVIQPSAVFSNKTVANNKTITITGSISGEDSNNYRLLTTATVGNITTLNIDAIGVNKVYDGTTNSTVTLNGVITGDIVFAPNSSFIDKLVGNNKTINIIGSIRGTDRNNYTLTNTTTTANITELNITCTGNNKIYDNTTNSTIKLVGIITGDNVISPTSNFVDKMAGNNKIINISGTISGTDSSNYILTTLTCTANITPLNITCTANNKIYDATTIATITLNGIISSDVVIAPFGIFNNKNVGNNKVVTINESLSGIDSTNYNLTTTTLNANITKLNITCLGNNKIYNGNTTASVTLVGILNNDQVVSPPGIFDNKNVGNNKTITINGNITGTDSNNYNLITNTTNADITPLDITINAVDKIYDGTTSANIVLSNIIQGDIVIAPTGTFDNKNVGINKTVIITGSITGSSSFNYNLTSYVTTTTSRILPLNIICRANNKQYDETNTATVELIGIIGNDDVLPPSAIFDTPNLGSNKKVTITGHISGNDSINYNLTTTTTFANIYKAILTLTFNTPIKQYDGKTTAVLYLKSINGIVGTDRIYLNSYIANYNDANVGTDKTVNVTNIRLVGDSIDHYVYSTTQSISGASIYLIANSLFINNPLYIIQDTSLSTQHINESNFNYDYAITVNLASLPGVDGDITHIFKSASYTQNTLNIDAFNTNINILPSNELNNFYFNWSDVNQQKLVTISPGKSMVSFGTFSNQETNVGDRILEVIAHKIFGNAQSRAAIDNDTDFYKHDSQLWDHLSESVTGSQIQNDIMKQYISLGRITQNENSENNFLQGADSLVNVDFNFHGLSFDYLLYINGSLLLNDSLTPDEVNILNNGPNVGGSRLVNGQYDIPILMKFIA